MPDISPCHVKLQVSFGSCRKKVISNPHVDAMSNRFHRKLVFAFVASTLVTFADAAFAADVKPPPQDQPAGSVPVDSKQVVCKRVRPDDGGMLPGPKICHTRAEWAALESQGAAPSASEPPKDRN